MTKETCLLENNKIYHIDYQIKHSKKTNALHYYTYSIKKINNIQIKDSLSSIDNKADESHDINNCEKNIEEERVDYLFSCVNELTNNMDCLLTSGHTKYIQIELHDKKISVATKKIMLPSGNLIFAGYFNKSLVVSDGNNYHIQQDYHKPLPFYGSLTLLLSQLVQGGGWLGVYNWPDWVGSTAKWFSGLRDPLIFPQSEGQPTTSSVFYPGTIIHTAEAEFSARLRTVKDHESDEDLNQAVNSPTASALSETLPPLAEYSSGEIDANSRLLFSIDGLEFQISLANREAQTLLLNMFQDFVRASNPPLSDPLSNLLEFDKFIGKKMAKIFHGGLYLKDKFTSLNIIISKIQFEDIISSLKELTQENTAQLKRLKRHVAENFMVENFISNIVKQLKEASSRINTEIIKDAILIIKNKTFNMAKSEVTHKVREKTLGRKSYYQKMMHALNLCQQAYNEYRLHLFPGDHSPLSRVTYINAQQIYHALINHDKRHLIDCLIKSKFYSIFDYTRTNGISIYSLNFIMPGEITDIGDIFTADEQMLTNENMDTLFYQELRNYIYQRPSANFYFERLLDIAELIRADGSSNSSLSSWQQRNIAPLEQTHNILSDMIDNNHEEKSKFTNHYAWHNELTGIIKNDKNLFVLLSYFINMQKIFINCVTDFIEHNTKLNASNQEQRIVAAKIEAVRDQASPDFNQNNLEMLKKYIDLEKKGDLHVFIKAASIWFISQKKTRSEGFLSSLNVLYVLKQFIMSQQQIFMDYNSRRQQPYKSVYKLESSSEKKSLEEYYNQFVDYKKHHSFIEARNLTMKALEKSSLHYVDIVYPAKKILCFKVFSRNYVKNDLTPFTFVSLPKDNTGYLIIATLHNDKTVLLSTFNGFVIITDFNVLKNGDTLALIKEYWENCSTGLDMRHRPHFHINETALASLFPEIDANSESLTSMIDILLHVPEEEIFDVPASAYSLAAVKDSDLYSIIKSYVFNKDETSEPISIKVPFINAIDNINQATLVAIAQNSKETLRHYTWLEYTASFIPFFTTLCQLWYDEEHEIKFADIIFDLYDLVTTVVALSGQFKKISENTFKHALYKATKEKVQHHMIRNFVFHELIGSTPNIGYKMAKSFSDEISSFYNIIHPSGKVLTILDDTLQYKIQDVLAKANVAIRLFSSRKKNLRQYWKAEVDENQLETLPSGILVKNSGSAESYYIVNDNDYFPVFWDKYHGEWRIINLKGGNDKDFAIPIVQSHSGGWVASARQVVDIRISPLPVNHFHPNNAQDTKLIEIEPLRVSGIDQFSDCDLVNFHKTILRFSLERHQRETIFTEAGDRVISIFNDFHRNFSLKKDILAMQFNNKFVYEKTSAVLAIHALESKDDVRIRFRAVSAWSDVLHWAAETYFAITVNIANQSYIIDFANNRLSFGINDNRDIFTENEWLMMFSQQPTYFELIKYKDFDDMQDARFFSYREATAPYVFIKDGFLIKEPAWYRRLLLKHNSYLIKSKAFISEIDQHMPHLVARSIRHEALSFELKEELPLYILLHCGLLSPKSANHLLEMIKQAKNDFINSHAILVDEYKISTTSDLLRINQGKILALYDYSNRLEHLMLCIGQGRFIGLNNNLYGFTPQQRVSLVIAEQLGTFNQNLLTLHRGDKNFYVMAGSAFGATDNTPILAYELPSEMRPEFHIDGRITGYRRHFIPREEVLFGKDCYISVVPWSSEEKPRVRIKHYGEPFLINNMDAVELADIIRGLAYVKDPTFKLEDIESIELHSCYSGYGSDYSTAQILADELGLAVHTFPHRIEGGIRQRRPEWFRQYRPAASGLPLIDNGGQEPIKRSHPQLVSTLNMQQELRDIMASVRNVIQFFIQHAQKNNGQNIHLSPVERHIPFIYIDILQLIYPQNPYHPRVVADILLKKESLSILDQILEDYDIDGSEEIEFIEQALLDIILSIDEFKYLSERFHHM
jgi:hypothetical protein